MSRIAFFTPLPPAPTGIADYSLDVLALLRERHALDVFHDQAEVDGGRLPEGCAAHPVSAFAARDAERRYELAVYQMGNAPAHAFQYPFLARRPGLLVLHDLVLHHSRARMFLDSPAARAYAADPASAALRTAAGADLLAYREEVEYAYPGRGDRLMAAQLGTSGDLLPYAHPLFRIPVEASRGVAVHNDFMAAAIRSEVPEATVSVVPMPMAAVRVSPAEGRAVRSRHGFTERELVVASFGLLTREKRIDTLARAVARVARSVPAVKLMLVGPVPDAARLQRTLGAAGVLDRTVLTGRVPFGELPAHIEAADVVVHLRYPTARETSAALLRVLAQGRPTVMADLEHLADVPDDAVMRADLADEEGEVTRALLRLADAPALRARLGTRAAAWVRERHSPARTRAAYEDAITLALAAPDPPARPWPAHWLAARA